MHKINIHTHLKTQAAVRHHPNSISNCNWPYQFNCKSDPSSCIDISLVCDGTFDCSDRSDELDCSRNRTKKDEIAANKLAKLIGLLKKIEKKHTSSYQSDARHTFKPNELKFHKKEYTS